MLISYWKSIKSMLVWEVHQCERPPVFTDCQLWKLGSHPPRDWEGRGPTFFFLIFTVVNTHKIEHCNHFLSTQLSGIEYIHIVVQQSPPSISRTPFILQNKL